MVAPLLLAGLGLLGGFAKQKYEKDVALDKQSRQANLLGSLLQPKVEKQSLGTLYDDPTEPPKPFEMRDGLLSQKPEDFRVGMETDDLKRATAGGMLVGGGGMTAPEEIRIRPPEGEQAYEFSTPERTAGTSGIPKEQLDTLVTLAQGGDKFAITQLQTLFQKQAGLGDEGTRETALRKKREKEELEQEIESTMKDYYETGDPTKLKTLYAKTGGTNKGLQQSIAESTLSPYSADMKFEFVRDENGKIIDVKPNQIYVDMQQKLADIEAQKTAGKIDGARADKLATADAEIAVYQDVWQQADRFLQLAEQNKINFGVSHYFQKGMQGFGYFETEEGKRDLANTEAWGRFKQQWANKLTAMQKGPQTNEDYKRLAQEIKSANTQTGVVDVLKEIQALIRTNAEKEATKNRSLVQYLDVPKEGKEDLYNYDLDSSKYRFRRLGADNNQENEEITFIDEVE
jgi:hypothetical protein